MKTKKLTLLALCAALAMVLSFVESQIPAFVAVPGVKIGLANIAVVFALYKLGRTEAVTVSLLRVFLVSLLFGNTASLFYSLAGAVLSLAFMLTLYKLPVMGTLAVSVIGAVMHNVGQIAMACLLLETNVIKYYLPFLIIAGTVAGTVIGIVSAEMTRRVKIEI